QPQPDAVAVRVLSVRLRAPDGGFAIEPATPETQWIEGASGPRDDPIAWHWEITPLRRGRGRLPLLVSARTVRREGITPETAPPDRSIEVAVRGGGFIRRVARWVSLLLFLGAGVALGRLSHDGLAQDVLDIGASLVKLALGLLKTSGFLGG